VAGAVDVTWAQPYPKAVAGGNHWRSGRRHRARRSQGCRFRRLTTTCRRRHSAGSWSAAA